MLFLRVLSLLFLFAANIRASSHWIVTETGLIQSKNDSPYVMSRPFDLLSFLNQEIRWQNTFNIYDDLVIRQNIINGLWAELEEQSDITSHVSANENCKTVEDVENVDWYTTVVDDGKSLGIYEREFMLYAIEEYGDTDVPDCKKISSLTFSMATFEHLEGMINRGHLNATPESTLPDIFSTVLTVDQYGHWLSEMLRQNTTSWLHYNLAAIYWRIKGNMPKALECSRRAVHYAPRRYKSIALLSMGSILHRSKKAEDAIIVLGASVDHAPMLYLNHFALGEAYAVVGDFNSSMKHLNMSIKLRKGFDQATKYRNAVLCHIDMFTKVHYTQRTLDKLVVELKEFHELETEWFKIHGAILKTMKHNTDFYSNNVEKNCIKMEEISNLKIKDLYKDRERNRNLHYLVNNPQYRDEWKREKGVNALQIAYDFEKAVKRTVKQSGPVNKSFMGFISQIVRNKTEILKEIGPVPSFPDTFPESLKFSGQGQSGTDRQGELKFSFTLPALSLTEQIELAMSKQVNGKVLYPSNMKVSRTKMDFDTELEWPSTEFCQKTKPSCPDGIDTVYPVFLPFEHKGISVQFLLTDKIGVPSFEEHELPWHPPLCPNDKDLPLYTSKKGSKVQLAPESFANKLLRFKLLNYVSRVDIKLVKNMQEAEIGQRIHTAMKKKVAHKWILYTIASLYWRVRGNFVNALNCLLAAHRSDSKYDDVALVSLASVLLEMGLTDDALAYAEDAYRLSPHEPPTNFLLAQLHMVKKHQMAQIFHLKQVLRVDPEYMNGHVRVLLDCWACIIKQEYTEMEVDIEGDKDICAEVESGVSMVCERDGTNCRLANRHCSSSVMESSTLMRMLEMTDDGIQSSLFSHRHLDHSFKRALSLKPLQKHDKDGHLKSYDMLMRTVAEQVALCKKRECGKMLEVMNLQKDECAYSHLFEPDYWLHYVSFQQELSEDEQNGLRSSKRMTADLNKKGDTPHIFAIASLAKIAAEIASMTPSHKKTPECAVPLGSEGDFFLSRILATDTTGWGALLALMQHLADLMHHHDYGLLGAKLAKYVDTHGGSWWGALAAGWWCGAVGRGACAVRCLAAAHALAQQNSRAPLRHLVALLHLQNKNKEAMDVAYLSFYAAPKSGVEAFLVGISHFYNHEVDEALWMYRYALVYDNEYVPATACLHIALCRMAFGEEVTKHGDQLTQRSETFKPITLQLNNDFAD